MGRVDGYAAIRDYAALADGRAAALVALDGSIDWLALPRFDSPPVFSALLDARRGGRFELAPTEEFEATREYVDETPILRTTFRTESGVVRVTDALTLDETGLLPWIELARLVQGVSGKVELRWRFLPRFDWGLRDTAIEIRRGAYWAVTEETALALHVWDAGEPAVAGPEVLGRFTTKRGSRALLTLTTAHDEPMPYPDRADVERRIQATRGVWARWLDTSRYDGGWETAVRRSALALKLATCTETGAPVAALTTSLPEQIGGDRNYDYRYAWVRDVAFSLDALIDLDLNEQVHSTFAWLLHATETTHPQLKPCYRLDATEVDGHERRLDLDGYRGSRPVLDGNAAVRQRQLGSYGDLLETAELYVREGNVFDDATGVRIREVVDHLVKIWRKEDSGIWELDDEQHYTASKLSVWMAFDRALRLVDAGQVPPDSAERWRDEQEAVREFLLTRCWSERRGSFVMHAGTEKLDAAVLRASRTTVVDPRGPELRGTIDAVREELDAGRSLLYRYSGQQTEEGAFLACSFWLVEALARSGRVGEARRAMDELVGHANDVGLFSEEIDPETDEFLGNFPQGLTHLSLITAASAIREAEQG